FGTNTDADGRFHSKWLNMMYPRLYLARNLLQEDGVIFISIDDGELENLRRICNEVFGEENFVATVIWQKVYAPKNSARHFSEDHDFIIVYARNGEVWQPKLLGRTAEQDAHYSNPDNDARGVWRADGMSGRNYYRKGIYSITTPSGRLISGPPTGRYWVFSEEKFKQLDADGRIWWGSDGNNNPAVKRFRTEVMSGRVPQTLWTYKDVGHTQEAKKELLEFVTFEHTDNVLDTVKPTRLIRRMLQLATNPAGGDLVLDFFAGSGPTGQAVLAQNVEDGGNRRFVLVQLPEPLPVAESSIRTIVDITKNRLRNFIRTSDEEAGDRLNMSHSDRSDPGFRVFKLDQSNVRPWNAEVPKDDDEGLVKQLELHVEHIRENRTTDDLLYEVLLKCGFPLTTRVEMLQLNGKRVHSVAGGALIVCLERLLTLELIRAMAETKPERIVCLDQGFAGSDQLKANAVQIFKAKGITSFKTV
ncbi:MAG: site-specific DNA-methyltransferase, partial [Nitrososphaera sp.]